MVSNAVGMELDELITALAEMRDQQAADPNADPDPEYVRWRAEFPPDWPM